MFGGIILWLINVRERLDFVKQLIPLMNFLTFANEVRASKGCAFSVGSAVAAA